MAHINLLPWREELRKQKQKEFFVLLGATAVAMVLVVAYVHFYMASKIEDQEARNVYLQGEIKKVEEQIKEINDLEKKREQMIARMNVIDQLQKNRPEIVHLFDELVKVTPDGLYVTKLTQKDRMLTIEGMTESNARVSSLMRALDESQWFQEPILDVIVTTNNAKQEERLRSFKLHVKQKTTVVAGSEDGSASGKEKAKSTARGAK